MLSPLLMQRERTVEKEGWCACSDIVCSGRTAKSVFGVHPKPVDVCLRWNFQARYVEISSRKTLVLLRLRGVFTSSNGTVGCVIC